jgi:hypothetical protein
VNKKVLVGGTFLGIAFSQAILAQNQMVIDKIKALDAAAPAPSADLIAKDLRVSANAYAQARNQCRPTMIAVKSIVPITGARIVLQAILAGQVKNAWSVEAEQSGCGQTSLIRYATIQKADGSLLSTRVNEGRSNANLSLMRDTSTAAALAAYGAIRKIDAGCDGKGPSMGVTRVVQESGDLGPEIFGVRYVGSWVEVWPFTICNRTAEVKVMFRADGDGGAYTDVPGDQVVILPVSK